MADYPNLCFQADPEQLPWLMTLRPSPPTQVTLRLLADAPRQSSADARQEVSCLSPLLLTGSCGSESASK